MELSEMHLEPIIPQEDGTFKIGHSHVTREMLERMRDHITAALESTPAAPPAPKKPAEPKKVYQILKTKDGRIGIVTPYSDIVIAECKRLMGKWGAVNMPDGRVQAWILPGEHEAHMRDFLAHLYDQPTVQKIVTFDCPDGSEYAPEIDGATLLTFSRDTHSRVNHPAVVEILEENLKTGGSARYPELRGTLKVRVRVRPDALIEWGAAKDSAKRVTVEDVSAAE